MFHSTKPLLLVLLLITVLAGLVWVVSQRQQKVSQLTPNLTQIDLGNQQLQVEIAATPEAITKGLGYRQTLGSDGMLFVLGQPHIPTFWMKGMQFDLDFVWINNGKVVDITENVPAQHGVPDYQLAMYSPKTPVTHVLEMNAGEIAKRGIRIGDPISVQ